MRALTDARAMIWRVNVALLALCLLASIACVAAPDETPVENIDPNTLAWVAPTTDQTLYADDVITMTVSTSHTDAVQVEFAIDGTVVGTCGEGCHDETIFAWAAAIHGAGMHTLTASFRNASGTTITATRTVTVLATVPDTIPPSGSGGADPTVGGSTAPTVASGAPDQYPNIPRSPASQSPDPGTEDLEDGEIGDTAEPLTVDLAAAPRGYLDPDHSFDNNFRGRLWAVQGQRILLHRGQLQFDDNDVAECMARHGDAIERYADLRYISRASMFALMFAETGCFDPDFESGDERAGPLNVSASLCMAMNPLYDYDQCLRLTAEQPSLGIDTVVRYLSSPTVRRMHHNDPVRLAAVYRSGSLRMTQSNPWHLAAPEEYISNFAAGYNAYRLWEAHGKPVATQRGIHIEGGRLYKGHTKWRARGVSLIGAVMTPHIASLQPGATNNWYLSHTTLANATTRTSELHRWHQHWNVDTVRLQVTQDGLNMGDSDFDADYAPFLNSVIADARAEGLIVIVSMRDEWPDRPAFTGHVSSNKCGEDLPCDRTRAAWEYLIAHAPALGGNRVLLEAYNEPMAGHRDPWNGWHATHTTTVQAIRAAHADNIVIVEGTSSGRYMPPEDHALDVNNVVYGIHPYPLAGTYDGEGDWRDAFGDFCVGHGHACLATEWVAIGQDETCYDDRTNPRHHSPSLSVAMQRFLRDHHIGSVMWPGDSPNTLVFNGSGETFPTTPTTWANRCDFTCPRADNRGSGQETRTYFKNGSLLPAPSCH